MRFEVAAQLVGHLPHEGDLALEASWLTQPFTLPRCRGALSAHRNGVVIVAGGSVRVRRHSVRRPHQPTIVRTLPRAGFACNHGEALRPSADGPHPDQRAYG